VAQVPPAAAPHGAVQVLHRPFLGATPLNIAADQPFTPGQILWINFLTDMPPGIALGFDLETPGLMKRLSRPRKEPIVDASVMISSILVGVVMAVSLLLLIHYGDNVVKDATVGAALALTAFAFFRIVCTYESRSLTDSVFRLTTFD
jgi:P-type Ca2+ transporter type 2C